MNGRAILPWHVYWANLNPTVGNEQRGQRPVVVVSSEHGLALHNGRLITILPLTTMTRPGWTHFVPVTAPDDVTGYVLTNQIRTISPERVVSTYAGWHFSDDDIARVRDMARLFLDL